MLSLFYTDTQRNAKDKERTMPRTPEENEAISNKVDLLLIEGYSVDQATAIAFDMFRRGKLQIKQDTSREYRVSHRKPKSFLEQLAEAAAILKLGEYLTNKNKKT